MDESTPGSSAPESSKGGFRALAGLGGAEGWLYILTRVKSSAGDLEAMSFRRKESSCLDLVSRIS